MEAVLAGHSHAKALGMPRPQDGVPDGLVEIRPAVFGLVGSWPPGEGYWEALRAASRGRIVLLSWMGNQHLAEFLFAPATPFDFVLEDDDTPLAPFPLVPQSRVRAHLAQLYEGVAGLERVLRGLENVIVVGTPPPKKEVRALLHLEHWFVQQSAERGVELEAIALTPPAIMRKLWRVLQALVQETAEAAGARFLPFPTEAMEDGFLAPAFWADVSHANAALGELVFRKLAL